MQSDLSLGSLLGNRKSKRTHTTQSELKSLFQRTERPKTNNSKCLGKKSVFLALRSKPIRMFLKKWNIVQKNQFMQGKDKQNNNAINSSNTFPSNILANITAYKNITNSSTLIRTTNTKKIHKYQRHQKQSVFAQSKQNNEDRIKKNNQNVIKQNNIKIDDDKQKTIKKFQILLARQNISKQRSLMGKNIEPLLRQFKLSRFDLHSIHSYYHVLLKQSKGNIKKLIKGIKAILRSYGLPLSSIVCDTLSCLSDFHFETYLRIFEKAFKQRTIEYLAEYMTVLFEGAYDFTKIRHAQLLNAFRGRVTEGEAENICVLIYARLHKNSTQSVNMEELQKLLTQCEHLANVFQDMHKQDHMQYSHMKNLHHL